VRVRSGVSGQRVLIGGVGYRWQRDASFGVVASDALAQLAWPSHAEVMDLGYGAIYAAQDLKDAQPPYQRLILLAAVERGRPPGRLYPSRWAPRSPPAEETQEFIREAGAGILHLDHLLVVAEHFQALPPWVELVELEPVDTAPGVEMSPTAMQCLSEAIALVRQAVGTAAQREAGGA
jgi:hydrogenase maturation protease